MTNYKNAKVLSQLTLGKATNYCSEYNPELLQAVPRTLNRDSLAIHAESLPFIGEDVWYAYELSWLNSTGKPIVAVAEFRFPCTSTNIVESKSFKLYLNSFNQSRF
jgi:7-cyano-7-deazaguanine reductase